MRTFVGILVAAHIAPLHAEKPKVDALFPAGGRRGTEFDVTAIGISKSWPLHALCDEPRVLFAPDDSEKGKYHVTIGPEVAPGPYLVRFHNTEGTTAPRLFLVGDVAERARSGPEPMEIPVADLPLTVNGRLESNGAVDRFTLALEAGQILVAEVTAYAIDSPLDPLLHVRGAGGARLAFSHDAGRTRLDPRLVFAAPATGRFDLELSAFAYPPQANIQFAGGAAAVYRLTLGLGPPAPVPLPPPFEAEIEGDAPQTLALPAAIGGRIDPAGDSDRYQFEAGKDEVWRIEVAADPIGSWMDPLLVIEDAAGRELKRQDDIDGRSRLDVGLDWTAPADGLFTATVRDLNGAGGHDYAYRLQVFKPQPGVAATAELGVYAIRPGGKIEIGVKVERRSGIAGEFEVGLDTAPAGVTAVPVAVPEKGEAKLVLEAAADAPPANGPVTVWVAPVGSGGESRVPCRFEVKGAFADAGHLLINATDRGWLTVLEKN